VAGCGFEDHISMKQHPEESSEKSKHRGWLQCCNEDGEDGVCAGGKNIHYDSRICRT
jgi:hypothetical protein